METRRSPRRWHEIMERLKAKQVPAVKGHMFGGREKNPGKIMGNNVVYTVNIIEIRHQ